MSALYTQPAQAAAAALGVPTSLAVPAGFRGTIVWVVQTHCGGSDQTEDGVAVYGTSEAALAACAEEDAAWEAENANLDPDYVAEYGTEEPPYGTFAGPRWDGGVFWQDEDGGFRAVYPTTLG